MIPSLLIAGMASTAPASAEVTVYNGGFALVKEQRTLNLKAGVQEILVEDVAQMIDATSVGIRSLAPTRGFSILEQNYKFDLINPQAILNKAVGNKVVLNRVLPDGRKERIVGTLMSSPTAMVSTGNGSQVTWNGMVIKTDDNRILLNPSGEIEVSEIPDGLISKPSLVWLVQCMKAMAEPIELSYLTQGMNWTASYVLNIDRDYKGGALKGWVTLVNSCGKAYKDVTLKLLAGEVNRVQNRPPGAFRGGVGGQAMEAMMDKAMTEEQFGEYHLYTVTRPVTVANNEQKQVSLLESDKIVATKRLIFDAMGAYQGYYPNEGLVGTGRLNATFQIEFKNEENIGLGIPMPEGKVKVFQKDNSGSLQMLGEDSIKHTAKKEKITLTLGKAFDVVGERKRTNFQWINNARNSTRETFEVEVRNRKETSETVTIYERHWGEWKITETSMPWNKLDANTQEYVVTLKPDEVRKITYTVETKW